MDSSGDLFVPDPVNLRIDEFTPTLNGSKEVIGVTFLRALGWKVNAGTPEEKLQICSTATNCQQGSAGNGAGQFFPEGLRGVAVDSSGSIYAVNGNPNTTCSASEACRVEKFNADGTLNQDKFGPASGPCKLTFESGTLASGATIAVAVDPTNQHLLGLKKTAANEMKVCELNSAGEELSPAEGGSLFPSPGLPVTSATAIRAGLAAGIDERVYAVNGAPALYILGPTLPPEPETLLATEIGTTTATLNGKVKVPTLSGETKYHFEYSADNGLNWTKVPVPDVSLGDGSAGGESNSCPTPKAAICNISQKVTELQPNTTYRFRLVAATSSSVTTQDLTLTTLAAKPTVAHTIALPVSGTAATLIGTVNPNNSPTIYRFEWGTTLAYGNQAPDFEPFVGSGGQPIPVKASIGSLEPSTTYHFRLVATNSCASGCGTTFGPDTTFTTNPWEGLDAVGLPDNRGVELVSPPDKRPEGLVEEAPVTSELSYQAADNGSGLYFPILGGLADSTRGGQVGYVASRGSGSWQSVQVSPPSEVTSPGGLEVAAPSFYQYYSPNLDCALVTSASPLTKDTPTADLELGVANLYRQDADGTFTLISNIVPSNPLQAVSYKEGSQFYAVAGMSSDCRKVFFRTNYKLLPGAISSLYEWDNGTLRDAGVLPNGIPGAEVGVGGRTPAPNNQINVNLPSYNAVSPNGSFFFSAKRNEGNEGEKVAVFARKGSATGTGTGDLTTASTTVANVTTVTGAFTIGETITAPGIPAGTTIKKVPPEIAAATLQLSAAATATTVGVPLRSSEVVDISLKQPSGTKENGGANYETASPDGSRVFFTANYGLAGPVAPGLPSTCPAASPGVIGSGEGCDLYNYNVKTGQLEDLSATSDPGNPKGASVVGVVAVSNDGGYVYFAAKGQLIPNRGSTYTKNGSGSGSANLYLAHGGGLTYVTTIAMADLGGVCANSASGLGCGDLMHVPQTWAAQATPSGHSLLFTSMANLTGYESGGKQEAYLYLADTDEVICVSCKTDGLPSVSTADDAPIRSAWTGYEDGFRHPRSLSEDGSRVFFTMRDALTADAVEGNFNLYEWEKGKVYLLFTTNKGEGKYGFVDAGTSGDDVFIRTDRQLNAHDTDFVQDVYDLKVNGGFPDPAPPAESCDPAADQCQGALSPSPGASSPASQGFSGEGNPPVQAPQCPKGKIRKNGKCAQRNPHHKKHPKKSHRGRSKRPAYDNRGGSR
jgi:hypothetical protein